jgi:Cof subfamily protein (haloacid dehalogenase superfamily)
LTNENYGNQKQTRIEFMSFSPIKMVVTDLDGTLLNSDEMVSHSDMQTLKKLGENGVIRVIATGRSPYSFSKVIPQDFPIDYLIFSSGAGAIEWKENRILYTTQIDSKEVQGVVEELVAHKVDFMVHEPIPTNHRFLYHQSSNTNLDFIRRVQLYSQYCQPYIPGIAYNSNATQILVVLPCDVEWFEVLKEKFPNLKVIRATSPLDGHSIWMEIFRSDVSKAYGIKWLCQNLAIKQNELMAIGNDYNDMDMLNYTPHSFMVNNAPDELKRQFRVVRSNNESGFSDAVGRMIKI